MKLVQVLAVFCAVIANTNSDGNAYNGRPYGPYQPMPGYTRIKRVKYSSPPSRFYNRPPPSYLSKGAYSYTPPPNWMDNDDPPPSHSGYTRPKVSGKRPTSDGLGDEDLQNFAKYLSQQDLDRIIEFAGHNRDSEGPNDQYVKHIDYRPMTDDYRIFNSIPDTEKYSSRTKEDDTKIYSTVVQEIDLDPKFNSQDKPSEYRNHYETDSPANYLNGNQKIKSDFFNNMINYATAPTPVDFYKQNPLVVSNYQATLGTESTPFAYKSSMKNNIYNDALTNQDSSRQISGQNDGVLYTDSKIMPEEPLPPPLNLRDDQDFDVSFTNNVPKVVKSPSYTLENFGDLPLMEYSSKLDTLSSYHVPHYTVTSSKSQSPASSYSAPPSSYGPASSSKVPVEPAPPISAAKEQSDAHLKAVRIWSHKSTGAAYTLHDDGSLSPEKPGRPKGSYGYP